MTFSLSKIFTFTKIENSQKVADLDLFTLWYDQNQKMVRTIIFHLCGKNDLDDLVQETFLKIWKERRSFQGKAKVSTWVYRIAVNTSKDYLRKKRLAILLDQNIDQNTAESLTSLSNTESENITKKLSLKKTLSSLPQDDVIVLLMQALYDFPLEEISVIMNIPIGTVKSRLYYIKQKMKEQLSITDQI